jgi:hypothetical protein
VKYVSMTAQSLDLILVDGVWHKLFTNPLDAYTEKYRRDIIFIEDHPNTASWRGYVAYSDTCSSD